MHDLDHKNKTILRDVDAASDEYLTKVRDFSPGELFRKWGGGPWGYLCWSYDLIAKAPNYDPRPYPQVPKYAQKSQGFQFR
jgi:hypothetical protein